MLALPQATELVRPAIFRVSIEPAPGARSFYWGTGFFVSKDGYALTAHHNLPSAVASARKGLLTGFAQDRSNVRFEYVPLDGDAQRDIALLKSQDRRGSRFLPLGVLPAGLGGQGRTNFWAGRSVLVAGFPVAGTNSKEEIVNGHLPSLSPIVTDAELEYDQVSCQIDRLQIGLDEQALNTLQIPHFVAGHQVKAPCGISGGPVFDLELGYAVAVLGAYRQGYLLASELCRVDNTRFAWPPAVCIERITSITPRLDDDDVEQSEEVSVLNDPDCPIKSKVQVVLELPKGRSPSADLLESLARNIDWREEDGSLERRLLSELIVSYLATQQGEACRRVLMQAANETRIPELRAIIAQHCPEAWEATMDVAGSVDPLRELLSALHRTPENAEWMMTVMDRYLDGGCARVGRLISLASSSEVPYAKLARYYLCRSAKRSPGWLEGVPECWQPLAVLAEAITKWDVETAVPVARYLLKHKAGDADVALRALWALDGVPEGHELREIADTTVEALCEDGKIPEEIMRVAAGLRDQRRAELGYSREP